MIRCGAQRFLAQGRASTFGGGGRGAAEAVAADSRDAVGGHAGVATCGHLPRMVEDPGPPALHGQRRRQGWRPLLGGWGRLPGRGCCPQPDASLCDGSIRGRDLLEGSGRWSSGRRLGRRHFGTLLIFIWRRRNGAVPPALSARPRKDATGQPTHGAPLALHFLGQRRIGRPPTYRGALGRHGRRSFHRRCCRSCG